MEVPSAPLLTSKMPTSAVGSPGSGSDGTVTQVSLEFVIGSTGTRRR